LPEDIAQYAVDNNIKIIGFSDHLFSFKLSIQTQQQFFLYIETIEKINKKYKEVCFLKGGELDIEDYTPNIEQFISYLDYVNLEYIKNIKQLSYIGKILGKLNKPAFLVHTLFTNKKNPHIHALFYKKNKELIKVLKDFNIGIELTCGYRNQLFDETTNTRINYYRLNEELFELCKDELIPISIGTDMHDDLQEISNLNDGLNFLKEKDLIFNYNISLNNLCKKYSL